ncbi:quorum sensing histidine kinase QseC [Ewingella americana]|uniref:Sensor protein QseC n=2 Tax=Ewingella americana TaxID=41202 RepID=A0A085GNR7_EWIA3|nr:quorum sensing histidine kinase QseC [Ewingella americana]KAA8725919.1 two-component system sensor histidine kinase QseC [Ewingella americana]KFC85362.1 sensory histidine kinase [Ewingella americana ATCC 33852]STQ46244.1 Sensor protein qseC [Ewingella americana]
MRLARLSLRLRLILLFGILALVTWLVASVFAWQQTRHNINEVFDTQQILFAKRLAGAGLAEMMAVEHDERLPETKKILHKGNRGHTDDDALTFAIFDRQGKMLLNDGENGKHIRFDGSTQGFVDGQLTGDDDEWRLLWLTTADGKFRVVVGQEYDYRNDLAWTLVSGQLMPWLASLPILLLAMILLITRELRPLRRVADDLHRRAPDDTAPLSTQQVPSEVLPLVTSLNSLFGRTGELLVRERRFTSDAAHELRSPLAALRVQTEVVQLSGNDASAREHALENLTTSIDRATRLVDQLLTLSRLESFDGLEELEPISWSRLLMQMIGEQDAAAHARGIALRFEPQGEPPVIQGQPLLLSLMLRNLIDNAVRYSPRGSTVTVWLDKQGIRVEDQGPGIDDAHLARLGERFYRPPGQQQTGSGLGVSIVQRIAQLHGLQVSYRNRQQGGLEVAIR